jgi:hypothetical protein
MNDANTESCWGRTVSRRRQPILTEQPDYRAITPSAKAVACCLATRWRSCACQKQAQNLYSNTAQMDSRPDLARRGYTANIACGEQGVKALLAALLPAIATHDAAVPAA